MGNSGKSVLTRISNNKNISDNLIKLLYIKEKLSARDAEYLFSIALSLINDFQKSPERELLIEYAYLIIATTCFKIGDFRALYDFSLNYGYYPISRKILSDNMIENLTINHIIYNGEIDDFSENEKVKTYEQHKVFLDVLSSTEKQISIVAPTSYGKSELIFKHIEKHRDRDIIGIIVPTKALIEQTFREAKRVINDRKIIIHDQNYISEYDKRVLAIVTQERALRLIEQGIIFDLLYIDEAHELLQFNYRNPLNNRSLLLSRLIQFATKSNSQISLVYLSPTIQNAKNLELVNQSSIKDYRIQKNLKILKLKFLDKEGQEFLYDRFLNIFVKLEKFDNQMTYVSDNSEKYSKNLHFLYRPKFIENYAQDLFDKLDEKEVPEEILVLMEELGRVVHPNFKMIQFLSKGIIYLHGKLPLIIRNYLLKYVRESNFLSNFIANSVILAGMNLPIDNLFYISGYSNHSDMVNLVGRVNRLNEIFNKKSELSKIFIPVHFVEMENYPQNPKTSDLHKKIEKFRNRVEDNVKNPILKNTQIVEKVNDIRDNEKRILENFANPDFFTRISKAGAQQILNYTEKGLNLLEQVIIDTESIIGFESIDTKIFAKIKEVFFDPFVFLDNRINENYFLPLNNVKRLRYSETINYYKNFLQHSFRSLHDRIESLYKYWKRILSESSSNPFVYVGSQFGEVAYETDSYERQHNVYVDLCPHKNDRDFLYNLAIIKIQTDEDFIGHEITLLLNTLKEFGIISEQQFNYFLYRTLDDKEIEILKLGISRNIYQLLKEDNQIQNIEFDKYGNARANEELFKYIKQKSGIDQFELEQFFR